MAALFPSYLGTLSEGFPMEAKKYESKKAVETYTDKLLNRLSVLLFHIDKQIDKVLLQGQFLPKKLNLWPLEARALKCQVSDLIQKQRNRKGDLQIREELVAVGIEMINQLKRCPFKDEYMYDKPIPEIVQKHEPDLDKNRQLRAQQFRDECKIYYESKAQKQTEFAERKEWKQKVGKKYHYESELMTAAAPQDIDAMLTLGSEPLSTSDKFLKEVSSYVPNSDPESINLKDQTEVKCTAEIMEAPENMPIAVSGFQNSQQAVESASYGEIQSVHIVLNEASSDVISLISPSPITDSEPITEVSTAKNRPIFKSDFGSQQLVELASYLEKCIGHDGGRQCIYEGCPRVARGKSGLCIHHGGGERCKTENCIESAVAESGLCISHDGGRRCRYPECTEGAQGNTVFCKAHGVQYTAETSTPITDFESITEDQNGVQSTAESMPISTGVESALSVLPETDEMSKLVPEKESYLFRMKDYIINLKLDYQTFLIGDYTSSSSRQLENSSVNGVVNLVERDLCQLPEEKSDDPNCYLLFLQKNDRLTHIHDSFFQTMPHLLFLDMSDTRIRILPSSLFGLSKLKVLLLRNCLSLDNLPPEIRELVNLEVLDLSGSELYDLPDEIGELTLLRHMQLSFYGPDDESEYAHLPPQLVSPGFLSKIKKLETLTISVHPDDHRWTKIAEPISKDIGVFENLSYLQFYFPQVQMFEDFIERSSSWCKGTLIKFKFVVGRDVKRIASRVPNEIELTFHEERQSLRFVNGNEKVPQVIQTVLARATSFYLDHHMKVKSLSEFGISMFKLLKFCLLRECPKIQSIIGNNSTEGAFPCLEHLSIYYLWELEYICRSPSVKGSFPALTHLKVSTCRKLKFVLWESMLPSLSNLKELVVEECESVEKIVRQEKEKVNTNNNAEMLPELRKLVLQNLPELVSLGNGLCSEDKLDINGCPKFILNSRPKEQSVVKQRKFLSSLKAALQFK